VLLLFIIEIIEELSCGVEKLLCKMVKKEELDKSYAISYPNEFIICEEEISKHFPTPLLYFLEVSIFRECFEGVRDALRAGPREGRPTRQVPG
jgi:hypothetical protein